VTSQAAQFEFAVLSSSSPLFELSQPQSHTISLQNYIIIINNNENYLPKMLKNQKKINTKNYLQSAQPFINLIYYFSVDYIFKKTPFITKESLSSYRDALINGN
jgi:hypothetical protein